ncbi:MAG: sigma-54-dependent Fis family transcriptional regulator [Burkholderiales bacterium]|nr:sigma-54-dependent Fis family transcriptional regulator [Burkholderiales bacterium]
MNICLIEDDPIMGEALAERIALEGFACRWARTGAEAEALGPGDAFDAFVSDIRLPDVGGPALFARLQPRFPGRPWIFITGYGTTAQRDAMLAAGAADFFTKPLDIDRLIRRLRAFGTSGALPPRADAGECPLGVSAEIKRLHALALRLGTHWDTVLVTGESGAGKEELARCLHITTLGAGAPFVAVNAASLPESLIEAELFGYERGAFTGAQRMHRGKFEQAHGGTLFLDEIGDMPALLQARLLRVLQDRTVTRLGGEAAIKLDVRVILATHKRLNDEVRAGHFREDLYYRVNVVHLHVPPLRERPEDVPWLAHRFVAEWNRTHPAAPRELAADGESVLLQQRWPGNVRELRNAIERACLLSRERRIESALLASEDGVAPLPGAAAAPATQVVRLEEFLREQERDYIQRALAHHGWQITATADALGISRKSLWERMKRLAIE